MPLRKCFSKDLQRRNVQSAASIVFKETIGRPTQTRQLILAFRFYLRNRFSQKFETDTSNSSNGFGVFMWADWTQIDSYGFCGFINVPSSSELERVGYSSNHYPNTATCLQATSPARQQPARPARKPAIQPASQRAARQSASQPETGIPTPTRTTGLSFC